MPTKTRKVLQQLGYEVLPHPLYSLGSLLQITIYLEVSTTFWKKSDWRGKTIGTTKSSLNLKPAISMNRGLNNPLRVNEVTTAQFD